MQMTYEHFWPAQKNGRECLATEAETMSDAVFLSVHQPILLYRSPVNDSTQRELRKEDDLLKALLEKNPPSGTLLIPIVGDSGVGKSHMIHWLDAQLRHRPDGIKRRVVRIPKSVSLRRVLELILHGLEGPAYEAIRGEMLKAKLKPELMAATQDLRAKLLVELDRKYRDAQARLASGERTELLKENQAYAAPQCIPALLEDPHLNPHFMRVDGNATGVLCRIAERTTKGSLALDGPPNQFTEEDITFSDVNMASLAAPTRNAIQLVGFGGGRGRKIAVRILNEVIDPAIAALMEFDGNSLTSLFTQLRKQLLADGYELVLLVEDFAALAGIQGSLLDAMIYQAVDQGEQVLCVLRTALAVTKGYLANRETVLTRARYEWHIEDRPFQTEEQAVDTYADFVGGYLNAARLGPERLQQGFASRSIDSETLQDWLPDFYEENKGDLSEEGHAIIKAFGFSGRGNHPLFPFNRSAIRQVLRRTFMKQGMYEFNPRRLLGIVLRETLIENRPVFERREFPPVDWLGFQRNWLNVMVMQEIGRHQNGAGADRMACLVFHWGDAPETPGEAAAMSPEIYTGFHARAISWTEGPVERSLQQTPGTRTAPVLETQQQHPLIPRVNQWRANRSIGQSDAVQVRKVLADEIKNWIDWDALLLKRMPLDYRFIHLPWASIGNPPDGQAMAKPIVDENLNDSEAEDRFFAGLLAVLKYQSNQYSWNHPGGERDAAAYATLIEPMVAQTNQWLRRKPHDLTPDMVKTLAKGLLMGARLLRIPGAAANSASDNLKAMLTEAPAPEFVPNEEDPWFKIREQARKHRADMLTKLKLVVVARQGSGEKVNGIDAAALLPAIQELRSAKALPDEVDLKGFEGSILEHLRQLRKGQLGAAVERRVKEMEKWRAKVTGLLGENFDIADVIKQLREAITEANQAQVYRQPELQSQSLSARLGELQQLKLKETLELAKSSIDANDLAVKINNIAQVDVKAEAEILSTLEQYENFLDQTSKEVGGRLNGLPPSPTDQGKCLAGIIVEIEKTWKELVEAK
jgi:hypothetical protein